MYSGDDLYSDEITSPLERPRAPRYQYALYGAFGEFMGITTRRAVALAHKARVKDVYYFRRYEYDAADPDWSAARERGLTCE